MKMLKLSGASFGLLSLCGSILTLGALAPSNVIAADDAAIIEEIVVTSRRRNESVQDVPLSVTAFGAEEIEQLKPQTLRDFDGLAPNVYIGMNTAGPGASALFIRGVGYADIEKTQSPQVGVIVDGIQMGSSTGQLIDVFDVESIEINRGPQGVLYGKNTIGGNIVVNRTRPSTEGFGINASVEAGNFETRTFKGRVNIPLSDTVALKVGATDRSRDGFYKNRTLGGNVGDVDFSAQTIALRFTPNDSFDAILTYDRIDDQSDIPPQDPRFDGDNPFVNLADKPEPVEYDVNQLGLRMEWNLSNNLTLNSITGLNQSDDKVNQDFDGAAIDGAAVPFAQLHTLRDQEFDVFTQEFRLSGDINDNLDFMVGVYYFDSELKFRQDTNNVLQLPPGAIAAPFAGLTCAAVNGIIGTNLRPNPNPGIGDALCQFPNARSTQIASEDVKSWAAFGSLTWRPTERLELSGGVRWIDEEKDATNSYFDFGDNTFDPIGDFANEHNFTGLTGTAGTAYEVSDSWDDVIFTLSGSFDINEQSRLYASYSEGFRSGGFSIRSARDPNEAAFDPEDAFQFELGIKNEFFDRRLRLNAAYFYLERDGSQFSSIIPLPPGAIPGTTTIINNGGTQEIQGFELETQYVLNENWAVRLNAGIIDVDNKEFSIDCTVIDACVTADPLNPDPPGTLRNFGGNDDSRQPEWNYALTIAYDKQFENGRFSANAGVKKVGSFLLVNTGGGADQRLFEGGYTQVDARVAYEWMMDSGDSLSVSLFGKNLSDTEFKEQALFLGGPATGFQGWGAPMTWGLEILYAHGQ